MGKVVAITNQKGGVGKTTTSINLSASVSAFEKKTLLIDIDPQANSSSGLGFHNVEKSIYEAISGLAEKNEVIQKTYLTFLDLIPASINLVGAEVEMVGIENREYLLKQFIDSVKDSYDFIFIDCPPSLGLLTLNALTASDSVIIPVQTEYFALEGLGQLLNTINIVKKNFNKDLFIEGVLLTMYDQRLKLSQQVAEEVVKYFGKRVFKTIIHRNVRLSEAPSFEKPVMLYDATSSGSQNYIALATEFINNNRNKEELQDVE